MQGARTSYVATPVVIALLRFTCSYLILIYIIHVRISIPLSHQGPTRKPKLIEQGVTIFTKVNDLNAEKTQPSGDLNPMQATCSLACSTAIQETRIPSEMCAGETRIIDGKHASLVICVRGNTHPYDNGSRRVFSECAR